MPCRSASVFERERDPRADAEWQRLAITARSQSRRHGLNQPAIDRTIDRLRYGRTPDAVLTANAIRFTR
jgi:hypothetical protein